MGILDLMLHAVVLGQVEIDLAILPLTPRLSASFVVYAKNCPEPSVLDSRHKRAVAKAVKVSAS